MLTNVKTLYLYKQYNTVWIKYNTDGYYCHDPWCDVDCACSHVCNTSSYAFTKFDNDFMFIAESGLYLREMHSITFNHIIYRLLLEWAILWTV